MDSRLGFRRRLVLEALEERRVLTVIGIPEYWGIGAQPDGFALRKDEPSLISLDVRANDFFDLGWRPQDDTASRELLREIEIETRPNHGQARLSDDGRTILYQPEAGFTGLDELTYRYVGGDEATADNDAVVVSLLVAEPWLAVPDWRQVEPGNVVQMDVLANDTLNARFIGSESWKLKLEEGTSSEGGTISLSEDGQSFIYQPAENFEGVDVIRYQAVDQDGYRVVGEARIRVASSAETTAVWPEELEQILIERAIRSHQDRFGGFFGDSLYWPVLYDFSIATASVVPPSVTDRVEATNNQISGVDESDRVKTDGEYLYVLSAPDDDQYLRWGGIRLAMPMFGIPWEQTAEPSPSLLTVVDVRNPEAPSIVSRQVITDRVLAQDLFGDRLTVIADRNGRTIVTVYDVVDPVTPRLMSSTSYSGQFDRATCRRSFGDCDERT
ncbi:MAG: Ig-like domain-containing protein [Pirellulaceae bacterium]